MKQNGTPWAGGPHVGPRRNGGKRPKDETELMSLQLLNIKGYHTVRLLNIVELSFFLWSTQEYVMYI